MKKTVFVSIICGLATSATVYAKPYALQTNDVDFHQVNSVLNAVMQEAVKLEASNGDNYDFVTPSFDPSRSSLQSESIAYGMTASVKNAPWSQGKGTVAFALDTYLKTDRASAINGVTATVKTKVDLDLLSLTRYVGQKMISNGHVQYDHDFEARERGLVDRMNTVNNMKDFNTLAMDARQLALDLIDRDILSNMSHIDCIRNLTCGTAVRDEWGNLSYDVLQYYWAQIRLRQILQTKSIALGNTIKFDGSTLTLHANRQQLSFSEESNFGNYDKSVVTFAAAGITVSSSGFLAVKVANLDKLHTDLVREFASVERDDSPKHERLQKAGREVLVSFRKIMAGEVPSTVEAPFDITN